MFLGMESGLHLAKQPGGFVSRSSGLFGFGFIFFFYPKNVFSSHPGGFCGCVIIISQTVKLPMKIWGKMSNWVNFRWCENDLWEGLEF